MISAVQFIILLACITICSSAAIKNCRCVNTIKAVNPQQIAKVEEIQPRPYCSKREVVVTLKDKSSKCLDPESPFTKAVLQAVQTHARMSTIISKASTAATTTSAVLCTFLLLLCV